MSNTTTMIINNTKKIFLSSQAFSKCFIKVSLFEALSLVIAKSIKIINDFINMYLYKD